MCDRKEIHPCRFTLFFAGTIYSEAQSQRITAPSSTKQLTLQLQIFTTALQSPHLLYHRPWPFSSFSTPQALGCVLGFRPGQGNPAAGISSDRSQYVLPLRLREPTATDSCHIG